MEIDYRFKADLSPAGIYDHCQLFTHLPNFRFNKIVTAFYKQVNNKNLNFIKKCENNTINH